ncbi:hypothetical protein [Pseudomonas sp. NCCP-436]|uniref:hypothetical protein n=1 Tax=Pseudomonas sp. NCCP-436 TaxID=2842481 RepID=UPI001C8232AB|nr:hypothetical protein [Pseudomonas sp. NCCP-436]
MRAERDDAPFLQRGRKKRNEIAKWLFAGLVGSGITLAALYGAGLKIPLKDGFAPSQIEPQQANEWSSAVPEPSSPTAEEMFWAEIAKREQEERERNQPKQTVFNDQNYIPRGATNTYTPATIPQMSYNQGSSTQPRQVTKRTHSSNWYWENGHNKRRISGRFEWVEVDGSIEWGSVCRNYRSGSLEYRDCRKGAKVAFKNMCGSYRPACAAENGFRP